MKATVEEDNTNHNGQTWSRNDSKKCLINFCTNHNLVGCGTIFPPKNMHKVTWTAPGQTREKQINHVTIIKRWRWTLFYRRNKRRENYPEQTNQDIQKWASFWNKRTRDEQLWVTMLTNIAEGRVIKKKKTKKEWKRMGS